MFITKLTWLERVLATEKFKQEYDYSVRKLAEIMQCSKSKVAYDLQIAAALKNHPEWAKIKNYNEVLYRIKKMTKFDKKVK